MFKVLQNIYGDKTPENTLMATFYSRGQRSEETIRQYGLGLRELQNRIVSRFPNTIVNPDRALRDRFVAGIRNSAIQMELRRGIRKKNSMTFEEVKQEGIHLEEEFLVEPAPTINQTMAATVQQVRRDEPVDNLVSLERKLMAWQQKMEDSIKGLQQEVIRLKGSPAETRGYRGRPDDQYSPDGRPVCRYCKIAGHIERVCRKKMAASQQVTSPPAQQHHLN